MNQNIFSSIISITKGLHRDAKSENEFEQFILNLSEVSPSTNGIYKINFKRPLNHKKEYYQIQIYNQTEKIITSLKDEFPANAIYIVNQYNYKILLNKFHKYLIDISNYITEKKIGIDLSNDNNYIITYLQISAVRLYLELQEQYGNFSTSPKYNFSEIMEKYFNKSDFDTNLLEKIITIDSKVTPKAKTPKLKVSFGYKNRDSDNLLQTLNKLQFSIDFLDNRTSTEQLCNLLVADNFNNTSKNIYIQCETTQFSYIVQKLKPYFTNFNPTSIEHSNKFFTKTDTPLKAGNLHKNKIHNPKQKEDIDNIFKQLQ